MRKTNEGANAYEHSLNHTLEFFSKAGSLFSNRKRQSYYGNEETALALFQKSWIVDKPLSMAALFWLRDARGGSGNRSASRDIYNWLAKNDADWIRANIKAIPTLGRWDDLKSLFGTPAEEFAVALWADAIRNNDVLAAKWADRNMRPLRLALGLKIGDFRRMLAQIRARHIVEHKMCNREYGSINYETVPSVAMARYTKAFARNDEERFSEFKSKLVKGEATVHADVLYPHDCVRTARSGDRQIADAQFDALPDFMSNAGSRIIVISDTSGSMSVQVAGSIRAVDISQGLALYCSSRLPEDSPFYKKFIGFCSESSFKTWRGMTFSEAVSNRRIFDGAIGSTRIDKALDLILSIATRHAVPDEEMPNTLLIVSDMQFHQGAGGNDTEVERCLKQYDAAGYTSPRIVYWNTAGYGGSQATADMKNVGLVSGFSPSILKAIFEGTDFSPMAIMLRTLSKYQEMVVRPEL